QVPRTKTEIENRERIPSQNTGDGRAKGLCPAGQPGCGGPRAGSRRGSWRSFGAPRTFLLAYHAPYLLAPAARVCARAGGLGAVGGGARPPPGARTRGGVAGVARGEGLALPQPGLAS